MKKLYGLLAKGSFASFSGQTTMVSKKLFLTTEEAEGHRTEFIRRCCDDTIHPFNCMEGTGIQVKVVEYELQD